MALDGTIIGRTAAELMELLEREHPDGELVDVLIIAEVREVDPDADPADEGDGDLSHFRTRCSTARAAVAVGLARIGLDAVKQS